MRRSIPLTALGVAAIVISLAGCSTLKGEDQVSPQELSQTGPTVINPRVTPETIKLNEQMQPTTNATVVTEIKSIQSNVTSANLRFVEVPFEVQMKKIGGTTWQAQLSPELLRKLAVGSQTVTYNANIYAEAANGTVGVSKSPVQIKVQAPSPAKVG